jgi:hypothetical protein
MAELTTVPQIDDLEKSILRSVRTAQREYEAMTDGWWLWHAPESFLQVIIAQRVAKETKHVLYISPWRRNGLHRLARIRTFTISQRDEFSLFTSKSNRCVKTVLPSSAAAHSRLRRMPAPRTHSCSYRPPRCCACCSCQKWRETRLQVHPHRRKVMSNSAA